MKWSTVLKRFFFVRKCVGCGEILDEALAEDAFCPTCRLSWQEAKIENCPICFQEATECTCMPKGMSSSGALCLRKLIFYQPYQENLPKNRLIYALKHRPNCRMENFVAMQMARMVREELDILLSSYEEKDVLITFLPRTKRAKLREGFDQSERIAKALAQDLSLPFGETIRRFRGEKEQKKLTRDQRLRNTKQTFFVFEKETVRDRYVILLDDVVTSGASMGAGVKAIMQAGARGVISVCIAYRQETEKKNKKR